MDGVLVIDKPAGPTSHDVVARVRLALGERRIGHTGTLDPFATGVLPLVVGRATRLARFFSGGDKSYDARLRLGLSTDTHDLTGLVTGGSRHRDPRATLPLAEAVEAALEAFRGRFQQRPPVFSAKKVGGVRSYHTARRDRRRAEAREPAAGTGEPPAAPLTPVEVHVRALSIVDAVDDLVTLQMTVSAGFYVRALAHDLGERLGCGAHLVSLRRTATSDFAEPDATPLDEVTRHGAAASGRIVAMDRLLTRYPAVRLTPEGLARAVHGNWLDAAHCEADGRLELPSQVWPVVRILAPDGRLVAVAEPHRGDATEVGLAGWPLHPAIVLT